jgi:hypothetical protein
MEVLVAGTGFIRVVRFEITTEYQNCAVAADQLIESGTVDFRFVEHAQLCVSRETSSGLIIFLKSSIADSHTGAAAA